MTRRHQARADDRAGLSCVWGRRSPAAGVAQTFEYPGLVGSRRRPPTGGWPSGIETVPLRDYAEDAPELARRGVAVVRPDEPIPVRAWVKQRQTGEAHVDGDAIAWAGRQVQVRYLDPNGREGWVWLWADAVERR